MKESIRLVRQTGPTGEDRVCMLANGKLVADMPYQVAANLSIQLFSMAKQIENDLDPDKVIKDQAILMRAGSSIGLTANKLILGSAFQTAQHDRSLRRYMPNAQGIESCEAVGVPTISVGELNHV